MPTMCQTLIGRDVGYRHDKDTVSDLHGGNSLAKEARNQL